MKPVTLINVLSIKPGMIDEFIDAQRSFSSTIPGGLIGGRMYRTVNGKTAILVSQFDSVNAQEELFRTEAFKEHLKNLRPMVESSGPNLFEEAYTYGNFK
jgi:heme-degrading monooxygenase HmoA